MRCFQRRFDDAEMGLASKIFKVRAQLAVSAFFDRKAAPVLGLHKFSQTDSLFFAKCQLRGDRQLSNQPLPQSEIILYQTEDGRTRIQCRLENETIWLSQAQIAALFQTTPQNANLRGQVRFFLQDAFPRRKSNE